MLKRSQGPGGGDPRGARGAEDAAATRGGEPEGLGAVALRSRYQELGGPVGALILFQRARRVLERHEHDSAEQAACLLEQAFSLIGGEDAAALLEAAPATQLKRLELAVAMLEESYPHECAGWICVQCKRRQIRDLVSESVERLFNRRPAVRA